MNDQTQPQSTQETEEKVKVKLGQAVEFNGEPLEVLELRKPVGKDIRLLGLPYVPNSDGKMVIDTEVIAQYLSRLANVPQLLINQLSAADFQDCMSEVLHFFGTAQEK